MALSCTRGCSDHILEKKEITKRVVRRWNELPRVLVESPFKRGLDVALGSVIWG